MTEYIIIPLSQGKVAIASPEDEEILSQYNWSYSPNKYGGEYAHSGSGGKTTKMHRLILDAGEGEFVDHINGRGLDNRRENLRVCTHQENLMNIRPSGKPKGVHYEKRRGHWVASIREGGRFRYLGSFDTQEEAARAYNVAAAEIYGEFAWLNGEKRPSPIDDLRYDSSITKHKPYINNKSGYRGVHKSGDKWVAQIRVKRKAYHLGRFDNPEEAYEAYKDAARKRAEQEALRKRTVAGG